MLPPGVQAKYEFECFGKGAAERSLLELTVTGAQPVAALHRQVLEVCDDILYKREASFMVEPQSCVPQTAFRDAARVAGCRVVWSSAKTRFLPHGDLF